MGQRSRRRSRQHERGQALVGALIAIAAVVLLATGLYGLALAGGQAGAASIAQISTMAVAEGGLNITTKILVDTANGTLASNLGQLPRSTAQSWGQTATSYSAAQQYFAAMMTTFGPTAWGNFPYSPQWAPSAEFVGAYSNLAGAGTAADVWTAYVGLIAVASPLPTWTDDGTKATLTFPVGVIGHAWVWQGNPNASPGQYLGEVSTYSPANVSGSIVITYQDCPSYYKVNACNYPTAVQVTVPAGVLMSNDPNASVPAAP